MPLTVQQMMAEANAVVERIDASSANALVENENALLLDVRDAPELQMNGRVSHAHHIPRGMLEFRADSGTPFHDPQMQKDRAVVIFCASGGRAALAGKLLKDMGYSRVYNMGGFKDWKEAGLPVEEPVDPGM